MDWANEDTWINKWDGFMEWICRWFGHNWCRSIFTDIPSWCYRCGEIYKKENDN